jgi:hypothetical protein
VCWDNVIARFLKLLRDREITLYNTANEAVERITSLMPILITDYRDFINCGGVVITLMFLIGTGYGEGRFTYNT